MVCSGLGIFLLCVIALIFMVFVGIVSNCWGHTAGVKSSDRETARRVLISDNLDDNVKIEILSIINDQVYWKYYEEREVD